MNLISGIYKRTYVPLCRAYAKNILGDKPADRIMRFLCSLHYWYVHGYWPQFERPRSFSEKLWNRMLFDRDPRWTMVSDKLRVRDYVSQKVGSEYLIPLLWSGDKPEDIPFDDLPLKFVIKTNHGCEYNIIVKDKRKLDQVKVRQKLKKWLNENFCQDYFLGIAWGYKNIKPTILIESFIEDKGKIPVDYKFYCFSGHVEILTLHFDRFTEHKTRAFNRNYEQIDIRSPKTEHSEECKHKTNFAAMLKLAESLAEEFDFIRVDLYSVENKIYFSELTSYPGGVSKIQGFDVAGHDIVLGKKWKNK